MPLTVADFNNDGFNDIYMGFLRRIDFTYLDANPNPLNTQGLFVNVENEVPIKHWPLGWMFCL